MEKLTFTMFKKKLIFVDKTYAILSVVCFFAILLGAVGVGTTVSHLQRADTMNSLFIFGLILIIGILLIIVCYLFKQKKLEKLYTYYQANGKLYYACFPNIKMIANTILGTGRFGLCIQIFDQTPDKLIDYSDTIVKEFYRNNELKAQFQSSKAMELIPLQTILPEIDETVLYCLRAEIRGSKNPRDVIQEIIMLSDESGQMYHFILKNKKD